MNTTPETLAMFVGRWQPFALQAPGGAGYRKIDRKLTTQDLQDHLDGKHTVGAYVISEQNTCKFVCFDIDSGNVADAYRLLSFVQGPTLVVDSGRKGYHVFQLWKDPVPSTIAYAYAKKIADQAQLKGEFFPRQPRLTEVSPLGSLIKIPFGVHRATGRRSTAVMGSLDYGTPLSEYQIVDLQKEFDFELSNRPTPQQGNGSWANAAGWLSELFEGIDSERNNSLNRLRYWLDTKGFPPALVELVVEWTNTNRCSPPLDERELSVLLRRR